MNIKIKEIATNTDQLKHFNESAKVRWEWLMDELQARTKYCRVVNILGHRYIVGIEGKL